MSNETKRNVFERALTEWDDLVHWEGLQGEESHGVCEFDLILVKYKKDYDEALPDDLPLIPKAVAKYINGMKSSGRDIWDAIHYPLRSNNIGEYMEDNSETFARAWLLGVWCVEETEEIVKMEEIDDGD